MSKPTCGVCGNVMTPENSKMSPELFLCDDCALTLQMKAGVARENELAWREQIESLKAQNAAMREALEHPGLVALSTPAAIQRDIALSTTPPSSYVSGEAVKPLVEALQNAHLCDCPGHWKGHSDSCPIGKGLITARELGVLK